MGLCKMRLIGEGNVGEILNPYSGIRFGLRANGSKRSLADLYGIKTVHADDIGEVGRKEYCKLCGELEPTTLRVDAGGSLVGAKSGPGGVFDVQGITQEVPTGMTECTYYLAPDVQSQAVSDLAASLHNSGIGLMGYVRVTSNSDERPAVLYSKDGDVLAMDLLFYDTELLAGIPTVASGGHTDAKLGELPTVPCTLKRREVPVVAVPTQTAKEV